MIYNFSYETSNSVIEFLLKNTLITISQNEELGQISKKNKIEKLDVLLNLFPENEDQIKRSIILIYNLRDHKINKEIGDEYFKISNFIFFKRNNGESLLISYDPQLIINYFNYLLPNTKIISKTEFSEYNFENLPYISKNDLSLLTINSGDIYIKSVKEIINNTENESNIDEDAVKTLENIIRNSIRLNASDIHFEVDTSDSGELVYRIRIRIDGLLKTIIESNNMDVYSGMLSQVKLKSGLKLDENRLPQDGRMNYSVFGSIYSFRVSTKPIVIIDIKKGGENRSEKIVIRKMPEVKNLNLDKLNYNEYAIRQLRESYKISNGFNIVTGPTGSGKTTLLYALLGEIDKETKNVSTIEDPVEAEIKGINQTQVMHDIGLNFAKILRAELRQDPDIIMVGEIRDIETAEIAAEASLTGHLVFSTLHTKNAVSSITRLINMGIPPFILASSLSYTIAQRLIRCLCKHCKVKVDNVELFIQKHINPRLLSIKNIDVKEELEKQIIQNNIYEKSEKGCNECSGVGYSGRTAIVEVFKIGKNCEEIIFKHEANESMLQEEAEKSGMMGMELDGIIKVLKGITSIDELYSVLNTNK